MTALLELRENLKKIYSRNEAFITPVIKFLLSFIVLSIINGKMGYMTKLDNMAIVLIVSLLCSFLPTGFIVLFAMMFSLLHMYALSLETAAVGLVVFLLLYLLFLRFTAKEAMVVVLTPVLCMLKLPYVMPVAMGLIGTPASCVSVSCGVVVYYLLQTVITNAPTINSMGAEEATAKLRLLIDGILGSKAMLVTIVAFTITVVVVYLIRRMSVDHSWTIAMIAGVMIEVLILLVGDLMYDTNLSIFSALLGAVVPVPVSYTHLVAVRPLRQGVISDYTVTEKMMKYFIQKALGKRTFRKPRIAVCVPSGVTEVEKKAVEDATYQAGAREVSIIEEPIAAAIGAGIDISKPCGNMIVDIGGGTSDIAVISLGGTVVSASIKIAGDDFDEAIVRYMRKKHNLLIGERTAEDLKIKIGACYKRAEVDYMDVREMCIRDRCNPNRLTGSAIWKPSGSPHWCMRCCPERNCRI